jgi:hypothetical protein
MPMVLNSFFIILSFLACLNLYPVQIKIYSPIALRDENFSKSLRGKLSNTKPSSKSYAIEVTSERKLGLGYKVIIS